MARNTHTFKYTARQLDTILSKAEGNPIVIWHDEAAGVYRFFPDEARRDAWIQSDRDQEMTPEIDAYQFAQPITAPAPYTINIVVINDNRYILDGTVGTTLDFTFETLDGNGSTIQESVDVYYTFRSPSGTLTATDVYDAGTEVHMNIDKYISLGKNTISIMVKGRATGTTKTVVATYNVVKLNISSTFNIAAPIQPSTAFEVTYTIEGEGDKTIEFYIDGELKANPTVSSLEYLATKRQPISGLAAGKHTLQILAKMQIGSYQFRSKLLYYEFIVVGQEITTTVIAEEFPSTMDVYSGNTRPGLTGEQYVIKVINWAYYSSNPEMFNATIQWRLYTEGGVETPIATRNADIVEAENGIPPEPLRFMPTESGSYHLQALINNVVLEDGDYTIAIIQNTADILEATSGLLFGGEVNTQTNLQPDIKCYYVTTEAGLYPRFNVTVSSSERVQILIHNGVQWIAQSIALYTYNYSSNKFSIVDSIRAELDSIVPSDASSSNKLVTQNNIITDYSNVTGKPKINNVELNGNKTAADLGLSEAIGNGTLYGGLAFKDTPPSYGNDSRYYYLAKEEGVYPYYGGLEIDGNSVNMFFFEDNSWHLLPLWISPNGLVEELNNYVSITELYTHLGFPFFETWNSYDIANYVVHDGKLYKFIAAHSAGAWAEEEVVESDIFNISGDISKVLEDAFENFFLLLDGKQDIISDLDAIRNGAAAGATAYQMPQGGIPANDMTSAVRTSLGKADTAVQPQNISTVASSGSYNDLIYKPDLSGFITKNVNDLVNYYLKSELYTKDEISQIIGAINQFHYEIATSTSSVSNPQNNVLYLIGPTGGGSDKYEEYVYPNSTIGWVKIGDTSLDLSDYITIDQLSIVLSDYVPESDLIVAFSAKADKVVPQTAGNIAKLTGEGNLADSGILASEVATIDDVTPKADKVLNAVSGDFAALDAYGNLVDSGHKHSDYLTQHQDISGKANKSEMSVVPGEGGNADKTTITLKTGTSATVLTQHQLVSGFATKVQNAVNGNFAGLDSNGNLTDSGSKASDFVTSTRAIPPGGNAGQVLKKVSSTNYDITWANQYIQVLIGSDKTRTSALTL